MLLLSHKAGLRAAEIAGLTWSMTLTSDGALSDYIALTDAIAKKGSGRTIPIHPQLRDTLLRLRRQSGSDGHVIKSERGERLRASSVVNWFRSFYADLGLEGCSSHSGRRTFITMAARKFAKAGGSIRDVQLLAGHASIQMTQRYIDGDPRAQRKLISLL
jgi:integrase/recombinase XerD